MNKNISPTIIKDILSRSFKDSASDYSSPPSLYLIGSLTHGGFSNQYSDIDISFIYQKKIQLDFIHTYKKNLKMISKDAFERISIFYGDLNLEGGRFPYLDRIDMIHNGELLEGEKLKVRKNIPTLENVRNQLLEISIPYWKSKTDFYKASKAINLYDKEFLRVFLYPARLIYSWETGLITSNDHAVQYLDQLSIPQINMDIIHTALQERLTNGTGKILEEKKSMLHNQLKSTMQYLGIS